MTDAGFIRKEPLAVIVSDPNDPKYGKIGIAEEDYRDIGKCRVRFPDGTSSMYDTGETQSSRYQIRIMGYDHQAIIEALRKGGDYEKAEDVRKLLS